MSSLRTYDRLENERQSLIRRIERAKAGHKSYAHLQARLQDVVTAQLRIFRVPAGRANSHGKGAQ